MTANQKKLINILRDMFQFDQADLDFGIYRIMGMKRDQITHFIEQELPSQITEGLLELAVLDKATGIAAIDKEIADTKAASFSESVKSAAIAELEEKKKALAGSVDIAAVEADVYNHLTNFFSRYYDEGDFISQRRYKDGAYAIPYEGEEVKLHWANTDQYYVKTSEYFKDYIFKTANGDTVQFKLIEAETELDNNKANDKRLFQLHNEKPFEAVDGVLTIYIEYKNGGKKNQKECTAKIVADFIEASAQYMQFAALLSISDGKTLLERQLNRYTARNTFDYFIHKDLGKFLRRELDFYIKNDVIYLDDIDEQDEVKTKEYLTKAKVIRKIAHKIIAFLAQIENFQKKLYLKKKFVVETNYCITLDRVPEALFPEIAANEAQREEWVRLFAIDEIEGNLIDPAYSVPLTVEFLKTNPFLVLDTEFFSSEFKEKLVAYIENFDEKLDGTLIHSENYQALNLLRERYANSIDCIYIDPPYNTSENAFLYKNNYKHSSWASMMDNRISVARKLSSKRGVIIAAIDDTEYAILKSIISQYYGANNNIGTVAVEVNPAGQNIRPNVPSRSHDYFHVFAADIESTNLHKRSLTAEEINLYTETDDISKYYWDNLRRRGGNSRPSDRPKQWFPIFQKNYEIRVPDMTWDEANEEWIIDDELEEGEIAVWPIDPQGENRIWRVNRDGAIDGIENGDIAVADRAGQLIISKKSREPAGKKPKTMWYDSIYSATSYGTKYLQQLLGKNSKFSYPKSLYLVKDCIYYWSEPESVIIDFFAGSGTTSDAIIRLNQEDGGHRKYIMVEMGEYFNTVTKPRIEKIIYSQSWKKGKPKNRQGSSHAFKYLRLESYEDALNNIVLRSGEYDMFAEALEGYMLSYMLSTESAGSASLLNVDKLDKPFSYKMNITRNLESTERTIDLVETFNYLTGLTVIKSHAFVSFDADFTTGEYGALSAALKAGDAYKFKAVEGTVPSGDKTLVLWREMTGDIEKDNAALDAYFLSLPNARNFKRIYVNCDNNLLNLRGNGESWQVFLIDEEMKKRMFEDAE